MHKSRELGMCTFDQALYELYNKGWIGYDEAIRNADSANGLRLQIKLSGERKAPGEGGAASKSSELSMLEDEPEDDAPKPA
jgi:twitching motility protein PilU